MDFAAIRDALKRNGYSDDTADARIAHDIVLKAVADCGFHDNITVKGGVVMSGRTGLARRATMDMDVDFLRYPLTNEAVRRFVARLNRSAPCAIRMRGAIETLHQQEYKGKRIHLVLSDDNRDEIETKMDIGVHAREDVGQEDFSFDLAFDNGQAMLLVNSNEQIFAEKLKSLLRFGSASTRYKDVFDLFYLRRHVDRAVLSDYIARYVFADDRMDERTLDDVLRRLGRVFGNERFIRGLSNPAVAWLDEPVESVIAGILSFLDGLRGRAR